MLWTETVAVDNPDRRMMSAYCVCNPQKTNECDGHFVVIGTCNRPETFWYQEHDAASNGMVDHGYLHGATLQDVVQMVQEDIYTETPTRVDMVPMELMLASKGFY